MYPQLVDGDLIAPLPWQPDGDSRAEVLARILRRSYGLSRQRWHAPGGMDDRLQGDDRLGLGYLPGHARRAVPSGGARYPCNVYAEVDCADGLADGCYLYLPGHHGLLRRPTAVRHPFRLHLAAVLDRNIIKYGDFGYRLHCLDTGVLIGQVVAAAEVEGLRPFVRYCFDDRQVAAALGCRPERECVYAQIDLAPATYAAPVALGGRPVPDGPPMEWDSALPSELHRRAMAETESLDRAVPPLTANLPQPTVWHPLPATTGPAPLPTAARRTCFGYFSGESISVETLAALLESAMRPYRSDLQMNAAPPRRTALICVVNWVDGLMPGVYLYTNQRHALGVLRTGDIRRQLHATLSAPIFDSPRAAVCFFPVTDYVTSLRAWGNRWFRIQNMETGLVVERLYLAAAGLGLDCQALCGYDPERVRALLGVEEHDASPLIEVMVGGSRAPANFYELPLWDRC
ncbi:nitroreductase family protein [Nocardia sp. NPDC051052]|uniref:nitroreductase family protein n=1 Tax=Nocardia sp. NPDC051052 TaxID=3364322 RepID=UPI0037B2D861